MRIVQCKEQGEGWEWEGWGRREVSCVKASNFYTALPLLLLLPLFSTILSQLSLVVLPSSKFLGPKKRNLHRAEVPFHSVTKHLTNSYYINLRLSNHQLVRKTLTIPYLRTRNLRKSSLMWLWPVRIVSWWGAHKVILAGPSHKTNIQTHWYEPDDFSSTSPPCTPWLKQIWWTPFEK